MDYTDTPHAMRVSLLGLTALLLCGMGLASCAPTRQPTPSPDANTERAAVTLVTAPTTLCRSATQIRLVTELDGPWPEEAPATWELLTTDGAAVIDTGSWRPEGEEVLVGFPSGEPLPPGEYRLELQAEGQILAAHTFAISDVLPAIERLELALTPNGPSLLSLRTGMQHFYIRYAYTGACSRAPFWVTVHRDGIAVCRNSDVVALPDGEGTIACYLEDGQAFDPGRYSVEFELMGETRAELAFDVGDPPPSATPTLTPTPQPVCEKPFIAAGLAPDGSPFGEADVFEWYTQAIYVGTRCEGMSQGIAWESAWYRNGVLVRGAEGRWESQTGTALVWDSLTGTSTNPFVPSGSYTVTLRVNGDASLSAVWRVRPYIRPTTTP